jgi:hypothetical protein
MSLRAGQKGRSESEKEYFSVADQVGLRPQIQLFEPEGRVLDLQWRLALELSKKDF